MGRLLNLAVVFYLVAHGVFVPRGGQADLVAGFCHATRAWLAAIVTGIGAHPSLRISSAKRRAQR